MIGGRAVIRACSERNFLNVSRERDSRQAHCSRFAFILMVVLSCGATNEAMVPWKAEKRPVELMPMSVQDVLTFANQTSIEDIRTLLEPILVERLVDTSAHQQVGEYLKQTLEAYGFTTKWDEHYDNAPPPFGRKKFRNLIATFDRNNNVPRRLVLACHYDSKYIKGIVFKAATDSALPCALLLDLARTMSPVLKKRFHQDITLQLIFLDGEEAFLEWTDSDSIYGARHLAKQWANYWYPTTDGSSFDLSKEIDRIDAFVLLDLLGSNDPPPKIYSADGHNTEELFQNLPKIEKQLRDLGMLKNNIEPIFQYGVYHFEIQDDHIPFLKEGVPIMHLIPVPFPRVWHTAGDDENALNNDVIHNLATILRIFVARYFGVQPRYQKQI